jgi:hypothetical protein
MLNQGTGFVEDRFDDKDLPRSKFTEFNLTKTNKTVTLNTERVSFFGCFQAVLSVKFRDDCSVLAVQPMCEPCLE